MSKAQRIQRVIQKRVAGPLEDALRAQLAHKGRGNRPAWVALARGLEWNAAQVAAVALRAVLDPRPDDEERAPSFLTVARGLGERLGAAREGRRDALAVGARLVHHLEQTGVVDLRKDVNGTPRVYPTADGELLSDLMAYATEHLPVTLRPAMTPPSGAIMRKNVHGLLEPADLPHEVLAAADCIQQTAFTINEYMLQFHVSTLGDRAWRHLYRERTDPRVKWLRRRDRANAVAMARELRGKVFYLPVTLDFRGRFYQTGAGALSYTSGSDTARSLLLFATGAPLTSAGEDWLTYHMAQCYGDDDATALFTGSGRQWVEENRSWIEACVADPHKNRQWMNAKRRHAFQFLAAAHAWVEARTGKPCRLPVTVDGTTSAMQHLCALTRDESLAPRVNLSDQPLPGDFYADVAAKSGDPGRRVAVKAVLVPAIYGSGARNCGLVLAETEGRQRECTLRVPGVPLIDVRGRRRKRPFTPMARRLRKVYRTRAQNIIDSARRLAPRSFAVLDWLHECAKIAGRKDGSFWRWQADSNGCIHLMQCWHLARAEPIVWTAPTGLRCVLDPRWMDKSRVWVELPEPHGKFALWDHTPGRDICPHELELGVRADYVHSLDASLLAQLIVDAASRGVEGVVVAHDCLGAHPNAMTDLMAPASSAFRQMYAGDVLGVLAAEFKDQGIEIDEPPVRGTPSADWLQRCQPFY